MKHLPADFAPPFRVHVETRPNKRDVIQICNDHYVLAVVESGTFKEGHAVARLIVEAVNATLLAPRSERQPLIPDGWKMVPIEPTKKMIEDIDLRPERYYAIHAMWHAMVAAAPKPAERSD